MPVVGSTTYSSARSITNLIRSLLNDGGTLLSVPNPLLNISRVNASSTVTAQTTLPHNLVPGDYCLVAGVSDNSFNSTFVVSQTLDARRFTMVQAGADASVNNSGQVQGYGIGTKFTDSVLMPYVNAVYQGIARELENVSDPTFTQDGVLLVVPAVSNPDPSVQVVLNDSSSPQLPVDLQVPLSVWERTNGSTDEFTEVVNLTDHGGLPPRMQGQTLGVWEWRTSGLWFPGATLDTQIRLRYIGGFSDLVDGTSTTLLRNMREAVAFPAAAAAGLSRGSPLAEKWEQWGERCLEQILNAATRQLQHSNYRGRPFGRRKGYTPF